MKFLKDIKKNVVVMGVASLFTDISSEMLYPVIPIFLTSVLGAPMSVVGIIEGLAESTASILKAFSGWLSDVMKKRRPLVILGYTLSSLSKPILFLSYIWPVVLVARFVDRLGKGLRTSPRDAMIADSSEASNRGKAFGFHRAMDSIGACIGPILAIWFLTGLKENLRVIFAIAFVPAILAVLTLVFFLKEPAPQTAAPGAMKKFGLKSFGPDFGKFIFVSSIFAIGNSSDAFLILRSKSLGFSLISVIAAYVLYNISYSVFSTPFGVLSDRIPRSKVMALGYAVFAAVYLCFGFIKDPRIIWVLFPVYGVYIAITDGVGKAFVSDIVAREYRATALGIYHFVLGIFAFFASLAAGLLWTHVGAFAPFLYGAVMAAISCFAILILIK